MSEDLSARYYKKNKERIQIKLAKGIKIFLKKRKAKKSMVANDIHIFLNMKNKVYLSIEKKYYKVCKI